MNKTLFNHNWLFVKDKIELEHITRESFETLDLPHTWNNLDGQDGGNDYVRTVSTYVKYFNYKKTLDRVYIEFEGVNSISNVYLNNQLLGLHQGGYSAFRYDITDIVKEEDNVLVVYVDNKHHEDVYPLAADFTFYGGIYRDVYIVETNNMAFDLTYVGGNGVYVSQKDITRENAHVEVSCYIKNFSSTHAVAIDVSIVDHNEKIVAHAFEEVHVTENKNIVFDMNVSNPHLWQGIVDPYLYQVVVKLIKDGVVVDSRNIKTGLRYFSFDHESFYLNGLKTKLNGVSRHQDRKDVGNALTKQMHKEDIELIKEMGANSIRLAHYQQSDYFYDLCDEAGMIIWAEIPYISVSSKTDHQGTNALQQMKELIIQNYNHSSIIMWGISNEITIAGKKNNVDEILVKLNTLTKELDPYRVTTMAHVSMLPIDDVQLGFSDVHGYNHYFGWYSGKVEDFKDWLSMYRKHNPNRPLSLSEYGVEGIHTLHSETPKVKDYSEEYHALWHEKAYEILENTPYVWGTYVWNMFAFAADFRDEGGSKGMNNKGLVTFDRKIKKDAFYYYQARWTTKPMLHLTQKRFVDRASEKIVLKAYSNQSEVSFYVNGTYVNTVTSNNSVFESTVTLNMGQNIITVKSGNLVDETLFIRVLENNKAYEVPEKDKNKGVMNFDMAGNWFDSLSESENPIQVDNNYLSIKNSLHEIMENEQGKRFVEATFKDLLKHPFFEMLGGMSIEMMREMNKEGFPYGAFFKINEALQKIKK